MKGSDLGAPLPRRRRRDKIAEGVRFFFVWLLPAAIVVGLLMVLATETHWLLGVGGAIGILWVAALVSEQIRERRMETEPLEAEVAWLKQERQKRSQAD